MGSPVGNWKLSIPGETFQLAIYFSDALYVHLSGNLVDSSGNLTSIQGQWNDPVITFVTEPFAPGLPLPAQVYTGKLLGDGTAMGGTFSAGILEIIIAALGHHPVPPADEWAACYIGPLVQ